MKTLKMLAPALPYAAIVIGIHLVANAWVAIALYQGGIVVVLACARRWPVRRSARGGALAAAVFVACASSGPLLYLLWNIAAAEGLDLAVRLSRLGLGGVSWWLFAAYFVTVHPVLEEAFWRGLLGSASPRPVANDLLFGGYHAVVLVLFLQWPFVLLSCLLVAAAAWLWRRVSAATGGTAWAIAAHAAADLGIVIAATVQGAGHAP